MGLFNSLQYMKVFALIGSNLAVFGLNLGILLAVGAFSPSLPIQDLTSPVPHPKPAQVAVAAGDQRDSDAPKPQATQTFTATLYAYSSTPDQTNGDPFITASGQRVADGIVANNCLPFGTEVKIHGKIYRVQDRMAARYGCNSFDVWHPTRQSAIQFGKQTAIVEVY